MAAGLSEQGVQRNIDKGIEKYRRLAQEGRLLRDAATRANVHRQKKIKQTQWRDDLNLIRPMLIVEEGSAYEAHRILLKAQHQGLLWAQPGRPMAVERHATKEFQLMAPRNKTEFHCRPNLATEVCLQNLGGECQGQCVMRSVVYELECKRCRAMYIGETSRSLGQRLSEHNAEYIGKKESSWAWQHVQHAHNSQQDTFGNDFKLVKAVKERSAFRRQLREEVTITMRRRRGVMLMNDHLEFNNARDLAEVQGTRP